jgi:hypothetical protein
MVGADTYRGIHHTNWRGEPPGGIFRGHFPTPQSLCLSKLRLRLDSRMDNPLSMQGDSFVALRLRHTQDLIRRRSSL